MYIYKFMIYTHARVPVWVQSPWQNNTVYVEKSEFSLHMCTRSLSELFYKFIVNLVSTQPDSFLVTTYLFLYTYVMLHIFASLSPGTCSSVKYSCEQ